jgi:hypothetical protein
MIEVLKTIKGFPDYQISNKGYVLSTKTYKSGTIVRKLKTNQIKRYGESVSLSNNGWQKVSYIHVLMAEYFNEVKIDTPKVKELKNRASYLKALRGITRLTYAVGSDSKDVSLEDIENAKRDVFNMSNEMKAIRVELKSLEA